MHLGPSKIIADKRHYLMEYYPSWFHEGQFNSACFLSWASERPFTESNAGLRKLAAHEVASVLNHYQLWNTIFHLSHSQNPQQIHQLLETILPFWLKDDQFDHIGFAAWYEHANFMDKEIIFKYLTKTERVQVLKTQASVMPNLLTFKFNQTGSDVNRNTPFLDNAPPIRTRETKKL